MIRYWLLIVQYTRGKRTESQLNEAVTAFARYEDSVRVANADWQQLVEITHWHEEGWAPTRRLVKSTIPTGAQP